MRILMSMNKEFERFIALSGGVLSASKQLDNCSKQLVSHIRTGKRDVSKKLAKQIIDKYPEISLIGLLYPEQAA